MSSETWKCIQHAITVIAHSFLAYISTDLGDLAVQLLQCHVDKGSIQWIVLRTEEVGVHVTSLHMARPCMEDV